MSTNMTDGLVLSAILLTIVGLTQIGRHRAYLIVLILPFLTCTAGAVFALASMRLNLANIVTPCWHPALARSSACGSTPR